MADNDPTSIAVRLGEIEDTMAALMHEHVKVIEKELKLAEALKLVRAGLVGQAEGENAEARKAWTEIHLRQSEDFDEWAQMHARRRALDRQQETLEKRMSACQTQLKVHLRNGGGRSVHD